MSHFTSNFGRTEQISRIKNMVCVKYYNRTKKPCQRCHIVTQYRDDDTRVTVRSFEETRILLTGYKTRIRTSFGSLV